VTGTERLGEADLEKISDLCRRSVVDPPSTDELAGALFASEQPAVVLGDPDVGVIAVVECEDGPHVRLLAVDPSARGRGHGHALLEAAEGWARSAGHGHLLIGADAPYFLWPGAPVGETALLCLLERHHYSRVEANFDMEIDLAAVPDDPGGHRLARPDERDGIDAWMAEHWPNWRLEVLRALDKGNLVISRDEDDKDELAAFCAFEVNRRGRLGPVAVRPDLMGRGRGRGVLVGALHELRRRGRPRVSVVWVGPVVPYGAVGGRVTDVYFVYRKELR
jgi:GNAT superfamily N-acetyltransferase